MSIKEVVHKQPPSEKWFEQHMRNHFPLRDVEVQYAYSKVDQYFRDEYASLHTRDKIKDTIVERYLK
jgi:hypothetical protein